MFAALKSFTSNLISGKNSKKRRERRERRRKKKAEEETSVLVTRFLTFDQH